MDYCFQIKIKDKVVCNIPQKSSKNLTRTVDLCSIISYKVQRILSCHHCWHVVSALHPLCRSSHSHSSSTCSRNCWHFRRRFNANRWAVGHVVKLFVHYIIQGKPLTVKCEVSDSESGGVFTWKIGNEIIRSMSRSLFLLWKHFIVKTFLPWNTNKPRKVWSQVWLQSPTVFSAEEASKEGDRIVDSVRFVPEKKVCDDNMMTMWWQYDDYVMSLSAHIPHVSTRGWSCGASTVRVAASTLTTSRPTSTCWTCPRRPSPCRRWGRARWPVSASLPASTRHHSRATSTGASGTWRGGRRRLYTSSRGTRPADTRPVHSRWAQSYVKTCRVIILLSASQPPRLLYAESQHLQLG